MAQAELLDQLLGARAPLLPAQRLRLQHRQNVVLHRQLAEDRRLLRQIADAVLPRAQVHRQPRNVVAVGHNAPRVRPHQSDDHVEAGRLARAVRPQQTHHLALPDLHVHAAHHLPPGVGLANLFRLKRTHRAPYFPFPIVASLPACVSLRTRWPVAAPALPDRIGDHDAVVARMKQQRSACNRTPGRIHQPWHRLAISGQHKESIARRIYQMLAHSAASRLLDHNLPARDHAFHTPRKRRNCISPPAGQQPLSSRQIAPPQPSAASRPSPRSRESSHRPSPPARRR